MTDEAQEYRFFRGEVGAPNAADDPRIAILACCVADQQRAGFKHRIDLRELRCSCGASGFNTGWGFWRFALRRSDDAGRRGVRAMPERRRGGIPMTAPRDLIAELTEALRPFAEFADPSKRWPGEQMITTGSSLARKRFGSATEAVARKLCEQRDLQPDEYRHPRTSEESAFRVWEHFEDNAAELLAVAEPYFTPSLDRRDSRDTVLEEAAKVASLVSLTEFQRHGGMACSETEVADLVAKKIRALKSEMENPAPDYLYRETIRAALNASSEERHG